MMICLLKGPLWGKTPPWKIQTMGLGVMSDFSCLSCLIYSQYQNKYTHPASESKPTTQASLSNEGRVIIWIKFHQNKF